MAFDRSPFPSSQCSAFRRRTRSGFRQKFSALTGPVARRRHQCAMQSHLVRMASTGCALASARVLPELPLPCMSRVILPTLLEDPTSLQQMTLQHHYPLSETSCLHRPQQTATSHPQPVTAENVGAPLLAYSPLWPAQVQAALRTAQIDQLVMQASAAVEQQGQDC